MSRRRATLRDVAAATGVSVPTVSRALRNHSDVSPETQARIAQAAADVGYRPHRVARALRTGRHDALMLLIADEGIGWWQPLLMGAGKATAGLGFQLLLKPMSTSALAGTIASQDTTLKELPVDGFVVVAPGTTGWSTVASATGKPVVVIDDARHHDDVDVFASDSFRGARDAVRHLVTRGRTEIAALVPAAWRDDLMIRERLRGYRAALEEARLAQRPELVWHTAESYPPRLLTSDALDRVLGSAPESFDAVFALCDTVAFSAMRSLRAAGRLVPHDVSVIGFDGDISGTTVDPPLSTVAQPFGQLGARAVHRLVELLDGADEPPRTHLLPCELKVRKSS
jgi:LacI family transcriptional regulator